MSNEEKIEYMRLATGMCGFLIHHKELDLLVSTYELIIEKEGNANMKDVAQVKSEVKNRDDIRIKQDLLDKVSTKS